MQVRLLGEVAIGTDAGWVTVAPRARRTLAALGLAAGWVPAERLAEQVWEAELPPTWRVALRGVMAELREAAGDAAVVETGAAGYRLGPTVERDVEVLRRDVGTATELLEHGRDRSLLDLLRPYVGITGDRLGPRHRCRLAGHGPGRRGRAGPPGGRARHLGRESPGAARRRGCRSPPGRRGPPARGAITPSPAESAGGGRRSQRRRRRLRPVPHGARRRARRRPERRDGRGLPRDARRRRRGRDGPRAGGGHVVRRPRARPRRGHPPRRRARAGDARRPQRRGQVPAGRGGGDPHRRLPGWRVVGAARHRHRRPSRGAHGGAPARAGRAG